MRKRKFSRAWKKLCRHIPTIFWRKPFKKSQKSSGGRRAELRKARAANRIKGNLNRNPLPRQTKQHRQQGRKK